MPYRLTPCGAYWTLRLWPHNALGARGFVAVIAISATALSLPLLAVVGSAALWGLLPFDALALAALWIALRRNREDRSVYEEMHLSRQSVHLHRHNPRGAAQEWRAHPAFVALHLIPHGGPVPHYLTLTGGGREVELGAFLTPEERIALHDELARILQALKT